MVDTEKSKMVLGHSHIITTAAINSYSNLATSETVIQRPFRFYPAVSEFKPPPGSRSGLKYLLELELLGGFVYNSNSFSGGRDRRGYRGIYKIPQGPAFGLEWRGLMCGCGGLALSLVRRPVWRINASGQ
jgi:hypothetical protein